MSSIDPVAETVPEPPARAKGALDSAMQRSELVRVLRYLYVHNPFYAISAVLVLLGLHSLFEDPTANDIGSIEFNNWMLLKLIAGYAVLLAVTAGVIVRLNKVWEDARTIVLTLVLLFVSISVSFDKPVLTGSISTTGLLTTGLLFSILLSEVTLRGLGVRLSWYFRTPYYLLLGLFFLYPALLNYFLNTIGSSPNAAGLGQSDKGMALTMWGVLLFPTAAGLVMLTLLPATWKGPQLVADNGTPWSWPLYPWSLFVFLSAAVVLRSFYLTISFHPHRGTLSGFGLYFLVPFILSVCVLLFEIGKSIHYVPLQKWALASPLVLLPLTLPGTEPPLAYTEFLRLYMARAGAPILMTWGGLVLLYVYAWLRRAAWAERGFTGLLVLGTVLGPGTVNLQTLEPPTAPLLGALTVLFLFQAVRFPAHSFRWFVAVCAGLVCASVAFWGTPFTGYYGAIPAHLFLAAVLALGLTFQDSFAELLRNYAGAALLCLSFASLLAAIRGQTAVPVEILTGYMALLTLVAWAAWGLGRGSEFWLVAWGTTICLGGQLGIITAAFVRGLRNPRGVLMVLGGGLSFVIAFAISLLKVRHGRIENLEEQLSIPESENGGVS